MELESSIHGADPPLFVDPFALSVTIGTAMGFNEKGSEQPHNLHAHVGFRIRKFEHHDIRDLSNFLGQDLVSTTGPIIIIVENWHKWANSSFKEALPALPSKLITELDSGLGFPTIPIFKDGDEFDEFYAATKHFDSVSSPSSENSQVTSPREQKKIRSSVIATWVKKQGAFVQDPERPTIVIFGRKISGPFTQRIVNHYQSEHARRWGRLCACLPWIFADIFTIFTNWDGVLQGTRLNIKFKEQVSIRTRHRAAES
ncbi:hypothetical protein F4777DRAFT_492150 [Nemania sp. FL0916]|nr:hypothetical protein F4777DRAFT_492150 [Nemania sp. FL0916]